MVIYVVFSIVSEATNWTGSRFARSDVRLQHKDKLHDVIRLDVSFLMSDLELRNMRLLFVSMMNLKNMIEIVNNLFFNNNRFNI